MAASAAVTTLDRIDLGFGEREAARIDATARALHAATRVGEREAAAFGIEPGSLAAADLATIRAHVAFCAIIARAHRVTIDPRRTWGQAKAAIAAQGAAQAARRKRGAGARAVANRYGDEAAREITGHAVRH